MVNEQYEGGIAMKTKAGAVLTAVLVAAVLLTACGGGGGGGSAPMTTAVISTGAMIKGSVIVNGVRFEDTLANITGDDNPKVPADLKSGMTVKVKGTRNDDRITGTANRIQIVSEVRGAITSVGTGTFSVLGQTVIVTSATITAGGWSYNAATGVITGLAASNFVEVHGARNAAGAIVATRVEKFGAAGADELRGIVSGLAGTLPASATFSINGFSISTNGSTTIMPVGATVANGTIVEVHLSGSVATRINVEDSRDAEFQPAEGQEVEVEGYISSYDGVSDFDIKGQHVHLTGSTRFVGGVLADIANDAKVEAEGHMIAGVLVADKIEFKDTIRFEANADGNGSAGVLGKTIYVMAGTEYKNLTNEAAIVAGDGLKIRGYLNSDGTTITATRVELLSNPVAADKMILQGPVSAKNEGTKTLTILGITVSLATTSASEIKDHTNNIITLAQFYASITLDRTAVKVRGTMGSPFVANQAELE
jgi:hypothetical protein